MSLVIGLVVFFAGILLSVFFDITMIAPLVAGFIIFLILGMRKGYGAGEVFKMAGTTAKDSVLVIRILLIIGCLTGLWRASGTIAIFVSGTVNIIPPHLFIFASFALCALMSYAIGTSFGVTATCGVIMMAIGTAGGANPFLTAGAIISGVYFGDRGSPAASSANLVAVLTGTEITENIKLMMKTAFVPFLITTGIYLVISFLNPMSQVDTTLVSALSDEFNLSVLCVIPAVIMIVLPLCKVKIIPSMLISIGVSAAICIFIQDQSLIEILKYMVLGYTSAGAEGSLFSGGGLISMAEISVILLVSCSFGGIFNGTGLLDGVETFIVKSAERIGRFATACGLSIVLCGLFCNQTLGIIMYNNLTVKLYGDSREEKIKKMLDIENSVILIAGLVPWCIACAVPLAMLGMGPKALVFAFYLYLVPLYLLVRK